MAIVMEVMEKGAMLVIAGLVESRMWSKNVGLKLIEIMNVFLRMHKIQKQDRIN